ncbi:hypothetical protein ACSBPQ_05465 [Stenotrophomonas sp. JC08]|uniref:hypothetical protein n=1 Tax=Stenotrophomonas sp. JC08 TaxID=3445779 RepID=UPI003FA1B171
MAVVLHSAFVRQAALWGGVLLVLAVAASSLPALPDMATPGTTAADSLTIALQTPGGKLPDTLPVVAIASAESELETLRTLRQRLRRAVPADTGASPPRTEDVLHAAATETGVRRACCRQQAYPLDPHLRLLNPGNAPPLA